MYHHHHSSSSECDQRKRSMAHDGGGEQLAVGGERFSRGHDASSFSDSFSEHEVSGSSGGKSVCGCKCCRTHDLTSGKLTLNCHYCSSGFMVCIDPEPIDAPTFVCNACDKALVGLSFTVRLCGELQGDIAFWRHEFETRDDPENVLVPWTQAYQQLSKMLNQENMMMVEHTLQLAKAFIKPTIKQNFVRAGKLADAAIKALLGYETQSVVDKKAFCAFMPLIEEVVSACRVDATFVQELSDELLKMKQKSDRLEAELKVETEKHRQIVAELARLESSNMNAIKDSIE